MRLLDITDHMKMGTLMEAWSRGDQPVPKDIEEFKRQLVANGIAAEVPETGFVALRHDASTLVLKVPSPDMLARLREPASWPLPAIYDKAFTGPRKPATDPSYGVLNVERFGDYSITNCG